MPEWRSERIPTVGLVVALALAAARVGWNLARPEDLFLDSWVLVHVLQTLTGEAERLPRGVLTLQYPIAYLPFFPLAEAFGAFATVKLVYPVVASLAAVPAYMVVRRGPAPIAGILAMLFLPDLVVKALTGTPQGIALPLFLLALFFGMRGQRRAFVATAAAILLVHHLTGLVTMVLYYAMFVLPRSREPGFLRREWPYIAFFSAWPLYWAWTFFNTGQSYMAPTLLLLVVLFGAPLAGLLYLAAPRIGRAVEWLGLRVAALSAANLLLVAGVIAAAGWSLTGLLLESPGLSTDAAANRAVVALYSGLLVLGVAAALARRHLGLTVFIGALLGLGLVNLSLGCQHVFDGLRVADYALLGGVAALFAPGLSARWLGRPLLVAGRDSGGRGRRPEAGAGLRQAVCAYDRPAGGCPVDRGEHPRAGVVRQRYQDVAPYPWRGEPQRYVRGHVLAFRWLPPEAIRGDPQRQLPVSGPPHQLRAPERLHAGAGRRRRLVQPDRAGGPSPPRAPRWPRRAGVRTRRSDDMGAGARRDIGRRRDPAR